MTARIYSFPARERTAPVKSAGLMNEQSELLAASKRPEKREEIAERVADFLATFNNGRPVA